MCDFRAFGLIASFAVSGIWISNGAQAASGFDGDTIHAYYEYPNYGDIYLDQGTFIAPGGGDIFGEASYSVAGDQVTVTNIACCDLIWDLGAFNGMVFVDLTQSNISGVSLDASTTAAGVTPSDASFTNNTVAFNFQSQVWAPETSAVFDVSFSNAVPEPSIWAMMIVGFAGLSAVGHRSTMRKVRLSG